MEYWGKEEKMKKHKTKNFRALFVSILFIIGMPGIVRADLQDILLKFQPYITVQEEYSNNINLTHTQKKSDFITTIYPGIRFSTLGRSPTTGELRQFSGGGEEKYGLLLDYRPGFVFYARETDNNYISQYGTLNAWYTVASKLTFKVGEYLNRSEEPLEPEYPGVSPTYISGTFVDLTTLYLPGNQRQRFIYLRNVVTPSIEYKLGRDSLISVNYLNNIYRSQNPSNEDSDENYINPKLIYWFNIRNGISLEYAFTLGSFERSPDLTGHMAGGRYTYRFNPRTSVFGEYYFSKRNFDPPGINYRVQTPSIGLEYAFSPTFTTKIQGGYFWQSPKVGSGQDGPNYNVLFSQRDVKTTYALLFQGGYREDFFTGEDQGFMLYHRAVGAVTYSLTDRITSGLSGSYEWTKSGFGKSGPLLPINRRDQIWSVSGNLGYQLLKWLNLSLALTYREDHSNIANNDYSEFRGMIKAEAKYL